MQRQYPFKLRGNHLKIKALRKNYSLLFLVFLAANLGMKNAKKEGKETGDQQRHLLIEALFSDEGEAPPEFPKEELLAPADQLSSFDPASAKERVKKGEMQQENQEHQIFLRKSAKKEVFDGSEPIFFETTLTLPDQHAGIVSESTESIPEEIELQTCQEKGNYHASIQQKLTVHVAPEVKKQTKICEGHAKEKAFFWKKDAENAKTAKKKKLNADPSIKESHIHVIKGGIFKDYGLKSSWKHVDGTACDNHRIEETLIQEAREEDQWETESPKLLQSLEADPDCSLLYTQVISGPQAKLIKGRSVFRDIWEREHYFSCGSSAGSKCRKLRELGGVLTGKKCLITSDLGDCLLWEKTFDLGRNAAHQKTSLSFQDEEIWGLSEPEAGIYEKNRDLPEVAATISVFAEINKLKRSSDKDLSFNHNADVFKGKEQKCQRSFVKGILYDCCKKMDGIAVHTKLAQCTVEEKSLSQLRNEGKCHYIGSKQTRLGTETNHVYCCYPTKLSRVIHEQGRKQLGISWGDAENPKCGGFALSELQLIDFTQIDFSEVLEDLAIDQEELKRKITNQTARIGTSSIQDRTSSAIQPLQDTKEAYD